MKTKLFAAMAMAIVFGSAVQSADEKNICDTAAASKDFTTFCTAVKEAALAETLSGKGPFTVFAPTDEAFKKLGEEKLKAVLADKDLLKKILLAHVIVEKSVMAEQVLKMNGEKVNGFEIKVDGDKVMIGDAKVTKTDIKCSNGVIHAIDTVLIPVTK